MKKIIIVTLFMGLFSCEKEGELTSSKNENIIINNASVLKYSGEFLPTSGITAMGIAKIYLETNANTLKLENLIISEGPDLKVYLSKESTPNNFVNLGNFKGTGTSYYNIPITVDVSEYKYVLIHCQQYNHLFAVAQLTSI